MKKTGYFLMLLPLYPIIINKSNSKRGATNANKAEKVVKDENGKDTFVRAEDQDAAATQWFDAIRAGKTSKVPYYGFLSPTKSAFANEAAIKRVEDWIDNGGEYPGIHGNSI